MQDADRAHFSLNGAGIVASPKRFVHFEKCVSLTPDFYDLQELNLKIPRGPILIRNVPEAFLRKLRRRAANSRRSINEEILLILRAAVRDEDTLRPSSRLPVRPAKAT
jgi:plasmid stability protein